jgi:inhibitor of KinA
MRIRAQGEGGVVVELGDAVDPAVNARVHQLARAVVARMGDDILDAVPSYRSLLVIHDPLRTSRERVVERLRSLVEEMEVAPAPATARVVRIPTCYGGAHGPDLADVARLSGLAVEEVVRRHAAPSYLVHFLGFTPGFPYLGGLDPGLATPRLDSPRARIPAGSVAIGGVQTGIYPVESPGGWRIVGRTPLRLFDPRSGRPFLLAPGDGLRFVPVDEPTFDAISAEVEAAPYRVEVER